MFNQNRKLLDGLIQSDGQNLKIFGINATVVDGINLPKPENIYIRNDTQSQSLSDILADKANLSNPTFVDGMILPASDTITVKVPRANDATLVISQDENLSIITDVSRYVRTITKTPDVTQVVDATYNNVALFSGVSSYIESDIAISGVKSLCIAFWINPATLPISKLVTIGTYNSLDTENGILKFWITVDGEIALIVDGTTITTSGVALIAGEWAHIIITLDVSTGILNVFKNSVSAYVLSNLTITTIPENSGILRIGSTSPPTSDVIFINAGLYDDYSLLPTAIEPTNTLVENAGGYLEVTTDGQTATTAYDVTFGEQWSIVMDINNVIDSSYYSCGEDFWAHTSGGNLRVNIYGVVHDFDNGNVPVGRCQLTITYDASTYLRSMYINGVLRSAIALETPAVRITGKLKIFDAPPSAGFFLSSPGQELHYMYVFNRVISTTEMNAYAAATEKLTNYPNITNTTTTGWRFGHLNIAWGRVWTQTDIDEIYSLTTEWLPRLTIADTFVTRSDPGIIALNQPLDEIYAPIANPVFAGTVSLPEASLVTVGGASLEDTFNSLATNLDDATINNPTLTGIVTASNATSVLLPATSNVQYDGTSLSNLLLDKANKDSPIFTGTVSLPAESSVIFEGVPLSTTLGLKAPLENPEFSGANGLKFNDIVVVNSSGNIASADRVPSLDAGKITTGIFEPAQIPDLSATKITTGIFEPAQIPDLSATKITTGIFEPAQIPDLSATKITTDEFSSDRLPSTITKAITFTKDTAVLLKNPAFTSQYKIRTTWSEDEDDYSESGATDWPLNGWLAFGEKTGGADFELPWNAFDKKYSSQQYRFLSELPCSLGIKYPFPVILRQFDYSPGIGGGSEFNSRRPIAFTIEASNDDAVWTVIQSYTKSYSSDANFEAPATFYSFEVSNTETAYKYWRMNITAVVSGTAFHAGELVFMTEQSVPSSIYSKAPLEDPVFSGTLTTPRVRLEAGTTIIERPDNTKYLLSNWTTRTTSAANQWNAITWAPELGLFAAVANSGGDNTVMTSPDGIVWITRTAPNNNGWLGITWAPELGLFAAVSSNGTTNNVMTSPDGIVWTTRTTPNGSLYDITWAPEIGLFAALGTNHVMTSPDGIVWTSRTIVVSTWYAITWAPELGLFAAIASFFSNFSVMTSPDGIVWTTRTAPSGFWNSIAWAPELGLFAAVGNNTVMTSPDGIVWMTRTTPSNYWYGIAWAPELGLFAAVGDNTVMTSPDGIVWITRTAPNNNGWWAIAWAPELGLFAAVAYSGGTNDRVMTAQFSDTRIRYTATGTEVWTTRTAPINDWFGIAWAPELGLFAAVGNNTVITSPDGIVWTTRTAPNNLWWAIAWAPELGLFAAVAYSGGTNNRVMTSPDGIVWTARTTSAANQWNAITWAPELGLFAAVANSGGTDRVMTSPDGIVWTIRTAPNINAWYGITWAPELGLFAAVATNNTTNNVMTSPDGIVWTTRTTPNDSLYDITWAPELGLFAALGHGNVMTSPDGFRWTRRTIVTSYWNAITWAPELGLFAAVADQDYFNFYMTSPDGIVWTTRTAPDGRLYDITWAPELGLFAAVPRVSSFGGNVMTIQYNGVEEPYMKPRDIVFSSDKKREVMRIRRHGVVVMEKLAIGMNPKSYQLQLSTDRAAKLSTSTWTTYSDERLKENIVIADYDTCFETVSNLDLKYFKWRDDLEGLGSDAAPDRHKLGWIAQEVEPIFPRAVDTIQKMFGIPNVKTVNSDQIYACMYGSVKKLIEKNAALENSVAALQADIVNIKDILSRNNLS